MPYRTEPPLRVYPLRTHSFARVVAIFLVGAALLQTVVLVWAMLATGRSATVTYWLSTVVVWVVAVAYVGSIRHDSVSGGQGEVRLFGGRVEVPPPYGGSPLVFGLEQLELRVRRIEGRLWFQTVSVVEVLHLTDGAQRRGLSSRLFPEPEHLRHLADDLAALRDGRPLPTHEDPLAPDARDEYDDELDAELEAFDD